MTWKQVKDQRHEWNVVYPGTRTQSSCGNDCEVRPDHLLNLNTKPIPSLFLDSEWIPVRHNDLTISNQVLRIEQTDKSDAGTYRCHVRDESGSVLSAEFAIHVSGIS